MARLKGTTKRILGDRVSTLEGEVRELERTRQHQQNVLDETVAALAVRRAELADLNADLLSDSTDTEDTAAAAAETTPTETTTTKK